MNKQIHLIKKLQRAIKEKNGDKITVNRSQFYSNEKQAFIDIYTLRKQLDDDTHKKVDLFQSSSTIQLLLFMRDYWYTINDWELPVDNEIWNKKREENKWQFEGIRNQNKMEK